MPFGTDLPDLRLPVRDNVGDGGVVPVIDIAGIASDPARWAAASAAVDEAARTVGFYLIVGHDVPAFSAIALHGHALRLFQSPESDRWRADPSDLMGRGLKDSTKVSASYGVETAEDAALVYSVVPHGEPGWRTLPDGEEGEMLGRPNVFPDEDFRQAALAYYGSVTGQLHTLLALHATALGLPRHYFLDMHKESLAGLVANYYPAQRAAPGETSDSYCMGPHTDWGTLTILWHSGERGLQVAQDGKWIDVPIVPGALVVNVGDSFAQIANYRSAQHRVECETGPKARERVSLVYFGQPGWDSWLVPVPGHWNDDVEPVQYGPGILVPKMMAKNGVK